MTVARLAHKVSRVVLKRSYGNPIKALTVVALSMTELGIAAGLKKDQMLAMLDRAWTEGE